MLEEQFATEEACRRYLFALRWPHGFRCPRCSNEKAWERSDGLFLCQRCGLQTSATAGTIFQDTKKPLRVWFRAIWHLTSQKYGANALGLQRIMGFGSYRTAWSWLHKLRRAMIRPGRDRLAGRVQVDETLIGGEKPGKRGRGAEAKALVLIAAQYEGLRIGRIRMRTIADAGEKSIVSALDTMVEPGAVIETDGWTGYNGLERNGYIHQRVRDDGQLGNDLLPACHRVAGLLKRWLLGTHQGAVGHGHLDYYLDEFTFRFNRRTSASRGQLFYRLLQQAVLIEPTTIDQIFEQGKGSRYKM